MKVKIISLKQHWISPKAQLPERYLNRIVDIERSYNLRHGLVYVTVDDTGWYLTEDMFVRVEVPECKSHLPDWF